MIKKIIKQDGIKQEIEDKLEVLRNKINEIIEWLNQKQQKKKLE